MTERSRRDIIKGGSAAITGLGILGTAGTAVAADGTLSVTVYADEVVDGEIVASPFEGVTVSDGAFEDESNHLGVTDATGALEVSVPAGDYSLELYKEFPKATYGVTTTEKRGIDVSVEAGVTTSVEQHLAPKSISIYASDATEYGEAVFITGETDYLGNWETAYRMDPASGFWEYTENLPVGAEYKIVKADWTEQDAIPTDNVTWEDRSYNRTISDEAGYYDLVENIYPEF